MSSTIPGLKIMNPSSVIVSGSGTFTKTTNGYVNFTDTPSLKLNGVFNSTCNNYYITFSAQTAATTYVDVKARLCISGGESTAVQYVTQSIVSDGTSNVGVRTPAQNAFIIGMASSPTPCSSEIQLFSPFESRATAMLSQAVHGGNSSIILKDYCGTHNNTSSHDGIIFFLDVGTITGTVAVYGFNE